MSEFEEDFKKLREKIENNINWILELINSSSSRISEIEGKIGLEKSTPGLWESFKEVKGLKHQLRRETLEARENLLKELRRFRDKIREASAGDPGLARELKESFEEIREFFEDRFEEAEDSLEEFLDKVEDVEDIIRDRIRELKKGVGERETYVMKLKVPEVKVPDIGKLVEESLSKAWSGVPSMIVSSVRLPRADLDLIDALVEAGIFKSRNEGIAYFAHRGIEASREWLNKVREKLEEIRKLQEETKKEMEKMLGETLEKKED